MITGLDHIVLLARDLAPAVATYETLLSRKVAWRSAGDGIETAIFTLNNMSLEIMAPAGDGPMAERVRARLDAEGEGLASLCFRAADIDRFHRRLKRLGLKPEDVVKSGSTNAVDGASLAWRRTRTAVEATHGVRLFYLEPTAERPLSATSAAPIDGLDHVVIATPDAERAAALYGARLGLDMRLDLTQPDWNARLMFFRCGDLIVEIVQRLGEAASNDRPDKLWGLSWRVSDIAAVHARLSAAGLDLTAISAGKRPDTQVFTVKSGTLGVPTLVIQTER